MNYIELINRFWTMNEEHCFSGNEIATYFYLLKVNNSCSWKQSFNHNNHKIMLSLKINSFNSYGAIRNKLKQAGLIEFKTKNGSAITTFTLSKNDKVTDEVTCEVADEVVDEVSGSIVKLKETKLNNILLEKESKQNFHFKNELLKIGGLEKLVEDWLKVRKTKKATNSETAFKSFIKQIEKSNKNINEILEICIAKDWKGFEADWIINLQNKNSQNGNTATIARNRNR